MNNATETAAERTARRVRFLRALGVIDDRSCVVPLMPPTRPNQATDPNDTA